MSGRQRMSGRAAGVALALALGCGDGEGDMDARGPYDGGWPAADAAPLPDGPSAHARLSAVIEAERQKLGVPGVAVAVIADGTVRFTEGFGVKWPNTTEPMDTSTVFVLGTATEPLTALGLLRLIDRGEVDLDAPVTKYVPEIAPKGTVDGAWTITVRQLLTQSSGLRDDSVSGQWPESTEADLEQFFTGDQFGRPPDLLFPPGRMYYHSTLAADLAGLIIERVSGKPFADYMHSAVFEPLGMDQTTFRPAEVQGDMAWGTNDGTTAIPPVWFPSKRHLPCCLAYSSVHDLTEFARFLMDIDIEGGGLLSVKLHQAMISPQRDLEVLLDRVQQGYGLLVSRGYLSESAGGVLDYSFRSLGHFGSLRGNTVNFAVVPERGFAFVYAANRGNAFFNDSTMAALELFAGEPPVGLVSDPVSRTEIQKYQGTYYLDTDDRDNSNEVTVEVHGVHTLRIEYPIPDPPFRASCDALVISHGDVRCHSDLPFPFGEISFLYRFAPPESRNGDEGLPKEYLRAMPLGFCAHRR